MYCTCSYVLKINVYDWENVVHNQTKKWDNVKTLGKVNNWFQKYTFPVRFFEMKFFTLFCVFYFVYFVYFVAAILFAYMYVMVIAVTLRQPNEVEMKNIKSESLINVY